MLTVWYLMDKVLCLIYKQVNATLKEFNVNRHYVTNPEKYDKFTSEERSNELHQLKRGDAADVYRNG